MALCRVFKNAKVLDEAGGLAQKTVYVADGRIIDVLDSQELSGRMHYEYEEIDCKGLALLPSSIDINLFPLDSKFNAKNLHTLANQALKGGVTSLFLHPYTDPYVDNEAMIALLENINKTAEVNLYNLIGNISIDGKLSNIDMLYSYSKEGRAIFSYSHINSNLLYQTMQYAKMLDVPLCIFAFDSMIEQGVAYESTFARELGLPMITPIGQLKEVAKVKEMAKFVDIEVVFLNLNLASCISMLQDSQNMCTQVGLPYLVFNERNIKEYDTRFKLMPPLLSRSKQAKLLKSLQQGQISLLTSMQSEVSSYRKDELFELVDESVVGIEHFFSLAYTTLVKNNIISLQTLIELTSTNAGKIFGLNKGHIQTGMDADFIIIDLDSHYTIKHSLSIYDGMEVFGEIQYVVVNGVLHTTH